MSTSAHLGPFQRSAAEIPADDHGRPLIELIDSGLLWLINTTVLHPRGFALALVVRGDEAIGWNLLGDGTEPWMFADDDPMVQQRFENAEATFAAAREPRPPRTDLGATS